MNHKTLILFLILIGFECCGLYYTKKYYTDDRLLYGILACIFYGLIPVILILLLTYQPSIGLLNVLWNVLSTIYGIIIGLLIFHEHLNLKQWIGVVLGIISIIFINSKK